MSASQPRSSETDHQEVGSHSRFTRRQEGRVPSRRPLPRGSKRRTSRLLAVRKHACDVASLKNSDCLVATPRPTPHAYSGAWAGTWWLQDRASGRTPFVAVMSFR